MIRSPIIRLPQSRSGPLDGALRPKLIRPRAALRMQRTHAFLDALDRGHALDGLKVMVIAAHPDDETIGAAALLGRTGNALVVHVTDGAPRDPADVAAAGFESGRAYARRRRLEAEAALAEVGLAPARIERLGFVDREAALDLRAMAEALADIMAEEQPDVAIVHPYEGGHPDHDAVACAASKAVRWVRRPPALVEMTSYHAQGDRLVTGRFLRRGRRGAALLLSPQEVTLKQRMLGAYASQAQTLAQFPVHPAELFRAAPRYDFLKPPHRGRLWYERYGWGWTAARFCGIAKGFFGRGRRALA